MHDPRRVERFLAKVNKTSTCWLWTGAKRNGYGKFWLPPKVTEAHRVSYLFFKGPFDKDLYVLHKCDVPSCVNPDHLFLGTAKDNLDDAISKGKKPGPVINRNKTHCPHGHPYSPENTNYHPRWGRHCLTCWRAK